MFVVKQASYNDQIWLVKIKMRYLTRRKQSINIFVNEFQVNRKEDENIMNLQDAV